MNINLEIAIIKNGLVSNITHTISQNLIADSEFDVEARLDEYRKLFLQVGVSVSLTEEIIHDGREAGMLEYLTGMTISNVQGGSQILPEYNPQVYIAAEKLGVICLEHGVES